MKSKIFPPQVFCGLPSKKYTIVVAALLIGILGFFFGERTDLFGSLGDEKYYHLIARYFQEAVFERGLDDYRLQRIVPPALVHYTLRLLRCSLTTENIIRTFGVYNIVLMGTIAYVWALITGELGISTRGRWLGFIAVFVNFHMLKYIPYIQVSTDLYAYAVTLTLVYFYLRNNVLVLLGLTFLGSFIWPTILYTGAMLILFPRDPDPPKEMNKAPYFMNFLLPGCLTVFVLWKMHVILKALHVGKIYAYGIFSMGSNRPLMPVIYLSIAVVVGYLLYILGQLLNYSELFTWAYWKKNVHARRWGIALFLVVAVKTILHYVAVGHNARPMDYLIVNHLIVGIMQPGAFVVSHVMFFGPVLLFLFFRWKEFCRAVQSFGPGLLVCMVLVMLFALESESRKQMNTFPILIPFLIKAADDLRLKTAHLWGIGILSVGLSKVWIMIHARPWTGRVLEFPDQLYYMNMGAWMSHEMYALQGFIVIIVAAAVYFTIIRRNVIRE